MRQVYPLNKRTLVMYVPQLPGLRYYPPRQIILNKFHIRISHGTFLKCTRLNVQMNNTNKSINEFALYVNTKDTQILKDKKIWNAHTLSGAVHSRWNIDMCACGEYGIIGKSNTTYIPVDRCTFKERFNMYSMQMFENMNWKNMVVTGGTALKCLRNDDINDTFNDIDVFIFGLKTDAERCAKVLHIGRTIATNVRNKSIYSTRTHKYYNPRLTVWRGGSTVNFEIYVDEDDGVKITHAHIQVVIFKQTSILDIFNNFDIDCCCIAYDNKNVYVHNRTLRSFKGGYNLVNPNFVVQNLHGTNINGHRLIKYCRRGFGIAIPILSPLFGTMFDDARAYANGHKVVPHNCLLKQFISVFDIIFGVPTHRQPSSIDAMVACSSGGNGSNGIFEYILYMLWHNQYENPVSDDDDATKVILQNGFLISTLNQYKGIMDDICLNSDDLKMPNVMSSISYPFRWTEIPRSSINNSNAWKQCSILSIIATLFPDALLSHDTPDQTEK